MTLNNGYLRKGHPFQLKQILIGIACWIAFSYILYAFFYMFREVIRYLTAGDNLSGNTLLILNADENYIYNLFFAAIASALGYMLAFRFLLRHFFFYPSRKTRLKVRHLNNNQGFYFWTFLFWFGEVGSFLGIWYLVYPLQYDFTFIQEAPEFLILLPIVLFFSTWPGIRKLIGSVWKQWLLITTSIFVAMSSLFALKDFINVEALNTNLKKRIIETAYDLQIPESSTYDRIQRFSLRSDLYVVKDTVNNEKPLLFINNISQPVTFDNLALAIDSEKRMLAEVERDYLIINIMMDSSLSIQFLNQIKQILRTQRLRSVQFSTGILHSRYPSDYPYFKYWGVRQVLPVHYPKLQAFLDSAEVLDLKKYKIHLPESDLYRNDDLQRTNRVKVAVGAQHTYLNNQLISSDRLRQTIYELVKTYSPDFRVIYEPASEISYGRYIKYLDLINSANQKLRNEMSMELYSKPFDRNAYDREGSIILNRYPGNIVEWTEEEKRLNVLLKKTREN